jgi:hypothetical protein
MDNPAVQTIFGDIAPDFAAVSEFTGASTDVGTTVQYGGNTYRRTGAGPTDWEKVSGTAGIGGTPYTAEEYGTWKTGTTATGALNLEAHGDALKAFADAGNVDATKDLYDLYKASGRAIPQEYSLTLLASDPTNTAYVNDYISSAGLIGLGGTPTHDRYTLYGHLRDGERQLKGEASNVKNLYDAILYSGDLVPSGLSENETNILTNAINTERRRRDAIKEQVGALNISDEAKKALLDKLFPSP